MSILRSFRYPTAITFGLLFTAALFWSLWSFTSVMVELDVVRSVSVDFSRTIVDTPVEEKF